MRATRTLFTMALLVGLAACGDEGNEGGDVPTPETETNTLEESTDGDEKPTGGDDAANADEEVVGVDSAPAEAGAVNVAVVTVGESRYEFDVEPGTFQRCDSNFFGGFWALGSLVDGNASGLDLMLPLEDDADFEDPPTIAIDDVAADREWVADSESTLLLVGLPPGLSQVESWTIDGTTVSGTATFIDENAVYAWIGAGSVASEIPASVAGTFEVTCAAG